MPGPRRREKSLRKALACRGFATVACRLLLRKGEQKQGHEQKLILNPERK
jgi:hypothetical protein